MNRLTTGQIAASLSALTVASGIAAAGAAPASADPEVCVDGPFGYAYACVRGPGWVDWPGYWEDDQGWHRGWGHGDGDDQGQDD